MWELNVTKLATFLLEARDVYRPVFVLSELLGKTRG